MKEEGGGRRKEQGGRRKEEEGRKKEKGGRKEEGQKEGGQESSDFSKEVLKFMKISSDFSTEVLKFMKISSQKHWVYDTWSAGGLYFARVFF